MQWSGNKKELETYVRIWYNIFMDKIKKDIILLAGIVLIAFVLWMIPFLLYKNTSAIVKVRVLQDGQEIGVYPILEDQTISIPYEDGDYNLMLISNGKVSVSDASCPDGLCVRQRAIARNGESIICLPHKLVIQIESKEESGLDELYGLDAVTY